MLRSLLEYIFGPPTVPVDPMKYLIAGLGNIGAEYEHTRHNIGFDVVEEIARQLEASWKTDTLGDIAEARHKGRTLVLLKPSTYMNRSGKAVRYWMQKKGITQENVLVVLDDLNLPFGKQRLRANGSDGGHNGLKDIDATLGGNNYARLRIGIGSDFSKGKQVNFVLGKWSEAESTQLKEVLTYAAETVKSFAAIGMERTMNAYNKK